MGMGQDAGARERPGGDPGRRAGAWPPCSAGAGGRGITTPGGSPPAARYMQMVQALEHGDRTQALVLLGELERDDPGSPVHRSGQAARGARVCRRQRARPRRRGACRAWWSIPRIAIWRWWRGCAWRACRSRRARRTAALATLGTADPGAFAARLPRGARRCLLRQGRQGRGAHRVSQRARRERGATRPQLLDLKIADLAAGPAPPATPPQRWQVTAMREQYQRMRT